MSSQIERTITADTPPNPDRPAVTLSVAMLLYADTEPYERFRKLVLVQNQQGLWSLPAGGKMPGELADQAVMREVAEETAFHQVQLLSNHPTVIMVERPDRTRVGLIYEGELLVELPEQGQAVESQDGETVWVKAFGQQELLDLVQQPDKWQRPEMNLPLAMRHLLRHWDTVRYGGIEDWDLFGMSFPNTYLDGRWLGDGNLRTQFQ